MISRNRPLKSPSFALSTTVFSMEFIDGEDLSSLLRRIGRLPGDKGVDIARQICSGLYAAHERGVVHLDLKPSNIMIDGRGKVRITDFGLARLTMASGNQNGIVGTPAYMAPEQLAGGAVGEHSDVYAIGLIFHEIKLSPVAILEIVTAYAN